MNCITCGKAIAHFFKTTEKGPMHTSCYARNRPYVPKETFPQVLGNCDDQVLVRQLLLQHVPIHVQGAILREFNEIMQKRNTQQ